MTTILVIDDDPTALGLMRTRLEKAGYKVKEARDGQQGLQMAENDRPDLIFLDVRMPKVDGWQVCRTLKSSPGTSHCPIVMLTGCSQDSQELYGLQCGADEYITKPWDAQHLLSVASRLLNRSVSSQDCSSEIFRQRIKAYIQRVVRMVGKLPKADNTGLMGNQLLQLATSLMVAYQSTLGAGSSTDFRAKLVPVEHQIGELLYWLGLLRDSKACDDADLPLLLAEGDLLREVFTSVLRSSSSP